MIGLFWFVQIGLVVGWLAGMLMKGGFGLIGDIVVGVLGAVLGGYHFGILGINTDGLLGAIFTATVGAVILIVILRLLRRA
ncbi:MAG: GlsB/YeaQ/YmgE family stress response membrane protein [Pseudodesulfovibrio sp.]